MKQLYIIVDKVHSGIMGLTDRVDESSRYDYEQITQAEVEFINHLEDKVFPPGTIATLHDLRAYRAAQQEIATAKQAQLVAQAGLARAKLAAAKAKADMSLLMSNAAAERGLTVVELEYLLEDRQRRLAAANDASNTKVSLGDDKARQSLIRQIKTRSNSKYPQGK